MQRQQYLGLLDMLDGGGPGRAGSTFEGGPLSGLLNLLGIRPMGYADRMAQAPTASPMAPAPMGGGMAPPAPRRAPAAPQVMAPALTGPAGGPPPQMMAPALTGPAGGPMPQITPTGTDPTRDPEFAKWFLWTTGTDVGMISPPTLRAVYDKWLAARMGSR